MIFLRGKVVTVQLGRGDVDFATGMRGSNQNVILAMVNANRVECAEEQKIAGVNFEFNDVKAIDSLIDSLHEVRIALTGQVRTQEIITPRFAPSTTPH